MARTGTIVIRCNRELLAENADLRAERDGLSNECGMLKTRAHSAEAEVERLKRPCMNRDGTECDICREEKQFCECVSRLTARAEAAEARVRELEGVLEKADGIATSVEHRWWASIQTQARDYRIARAALQPAPEAGKIGKEGVVSREPFEAGDE